MRNGLILPRLASSSRCLHVAQHLLGEASGTSIARARLISTAPAHETSKFPKAVPLSKRLTLAIKREPDALSSEENPTPVSRDHTKPETTLSPGKPRKKVKMKIREKPLTAHEAVQETARKLRSMEKRVVAATSVLSRKNTKTHKPPIDFSKEPVPFPAAEPGKSPENARDSKLSPEEKFFAKEAWAPDSWDVLPTASTPLPKANLPPHITPVKTVVEGILEGDSGTLIDVVPRSEHLPISTLEHGLDRVLFNPGVHWLRDPRSRVYNFTPWLEKIPKVNDFAFERLSGFVKSSRDEDLRALAKQENKEFAGSTSSMSGMLSHIYFLLSDHKEVELKSLSQHFSQESTRFTSAQRMPTSVELNYKDGVYAVDSHSGDYDDSDKNVLTWLGTLLENFLTKEPKEFKKFIREESQPITQETKPMREAYRFAKSDKFVMRSQLDCHDTRLPGTGVFDLKTRACISIRMDILNYEESSGYMIKTQHGLLESFEREYYDLIRAAFLKYSFQVRIGNMDGVMVAYHNTERIYGFQYISLDEMDARLYGEVPGIGDKIFKKCVGLLEAILTEATKAFPEQSVLCNFETVQRTMGTNSTLDVFVVPSAWDGVAHERPIKQFAVTVAHELDGESVRPSVALRSINEEWTMKYTISTVDLPADVMRFNLQRLESRKARSLYLPADVEMDGAQEYWENLNFNNQRPAEDGDPKMFRPEAFSIARGMIEDYRVLSRKGREEYKEMEMNEAGKPKIVLGQGVYQEEEVLSSKEAQTSASEVEQSHEAKAEAVEKADEVDDIQEVDTEKKADQ